jgi:hypothetical protein
MSTANNGNWAVLLGEFHALVQDAPNANKIKEQLLALNEKAKLANDLTFRQIDGIRDRINNYLNGDYGKTKSGIKFQGA